MIQLNWLAIILAGFTPMIIGAIWYGPLFGKIWMEETGLTEDLLKKSNMPKIYGFATLLSIFFSIGVLPYVVHQMHVSSSLMNQDVTTAGSDAALYFADYIAKYGNEFRTLKHGAIHGFILSIFMALPIIGVNALFERKSWRYIFINVGYWMSSLIVVGAIISAYA